MDAEALKAAGVPFGPLFGQIKNGQDVVLEDGTKIIAKDFISAPKKGKVITILGDTRKTNASVRLGLGADVLVHERLLMVRAMKKFARAMGIQPTCKQHKSLRMRQPNVFF